MRAHLTPLALCVLIAACGQGNIEQVPDVPDDVSSGDATLSCDHGLAVDTPLALRDGRPHTVYAYGRSLDGRTQPLLGGSPKPLRCTLPRVGDFNGDGRADVIQYQPQGWDAVPVCLSPRSGWTCRQLRAFYAGGMGEGNNGSGVY